KLGEITRPEADAIAVRRRAALEEDLGRARESESTMSMDLSFGLGVWKTYQGGSDKRVPEASPKVDRAKLVELLSKQASVPDDFHPHPKIERLLKQREAMAHGEHPLDW